jgi:hypothetical protein
MSANGIRTVAPAGHGFAKGRVHIFHIHVNGDRRPTGAFGSATTHLGHFIYEKNVRVPDLEIGMHDGFSIRPGQSADLLGSKSLLVEFNGFAGAFHYQVWCQCVKAAGNWLNSAAHDLSFRF